MVSIQIGAAQPCRWQIRVTRACTSAMSSNVVGLTTIATNGDRGYGAPALRLIPPIPARYPRPGCHARGVVVDSGAPAGRK